MLFLFYIFGCQSHVHDSSMPENLDEEIFLEISPEWSVEEVEEHLNTAFSLGFPSLPDIRTLYSSYLQQRTYLCPTMENPSSTSWVGVWQSYCVSETGYLYEGQALYSEDIFVESSYFYQNMVASFFLQSPQDESFLGGGEFESLWTLESENRFFWEGRIGGTYRYSHAEDWLQDGEVSLFWTAMGENSLEEIHVDGGIGYQSVEPHIYVYFENISLREGRLEGYLFLRDPSSYWWKIPIQPESNTCSVLLFDDVEKGQICVGTSLLSLLQKWYVDMKEYVDTDVFVQQDVQ